MKEAKFICAGDRVAVRLIWRGTNTGSFNGMPPTGKPVAFGTTNIFRGANRKIAENWPQVDMMTLMQQLGAVPTP
jgi:predicted ester cyclase